MKAQDINQLKPIGNTSANPPKALQKKETDFHSILRGGFTTPFSKDSITAVPGFTGPFPNLSLEPTSVAASRTEAINAYKKLESQYDNHRPISALGKYKEDQLLSNPGGDHYYLEQRRVVSHPKDQESFFGRVGKDLSDTFGNVKNFFKNLFFGSKILYRDKNNQIQEASQRGLIGSVGDFFKDLGSALSFGMWRPDGENEPQGFVKRVGFFFSKMKEAVFGDLVQGVSGSVIHMGEDLVFAGWNLAESLPDATIGNFQAGRKLTTAIFDNGQVAMDYLTDILPSGEAWVRVHSPNLKDLRAPILNNIKMPENHPEDERWKYVRNTTFRKSIETIGSLLTDILTFQLLGQIKLFGEKDHQKN